MKRMRWPTLAAILAVVLGTGVTATPSVAQVAATIPVESSCHLNSIGWADPARCLPAVRQHALPPRQLEHRLGPAADAAPAELPDQQRHAVHERPHDPHLPHGGGILSTMTGLYPDRQGITVSNSYFYPVAGQGARPSAQPSSTGPTSSTTRRASRIPCRTWSRDQQKTTPAPWVPYTRAGCDVGAISLANVELENTGTGPFGDMSEAFGTGSPEWNDAVASNAAPAGTAARAKALTDYIGIAVHCGQGGGICASNADNVANSRS